MVPCSSPIDANVNLVEAWLFQAILVVCQCFYLIANEAKPKFIFSKRNLVWSGEHSCDKKRST